MVFPWSDDKSTYLAMIVKVTIEGQDSVVVREQRTNMYYLSRDKTTYGLARVGR